ncbi:MAG: FAD-binding protein [Mongoliibacter sp.]|uniref:FAD-binding protein n=1 Tax=Mongoliibacter sp. TaxID=2022438 RepID=UPI0012EF6D13|nr:FAD-binding protein [Mongoliibacter sp.]TVP53127.1 MAG: FAD-binding protein [Mongoliibacter sp.]
MDKRTFLKNSSLVIGAAITGTWNSCSPKKSDTQMQEVIKNWAGNLEFSTNQIHFPDSLEKAQRLVQKLPKLRVLGSKHSFNTIADSTVNLVSTEKLNRVIQLDKDNAQVTVEAGVKYGELCEMLHENGFALHNLASLPHISVAGSIATATHGSGLENGNLASSVSGLEFINGKGELIELKKGEADFDGAVVALGALGMVTKVTLDLVPTFEVAQVVYRQMPVQALEENFLKIMSEGYSVSLFTDWTTDTINEVWVKKKVEPGKDTHFEEEFFGAKQAESNIHPVEGMDAQSCTEQMGVPGPWFDRLPHFKMQFQPSAGEELQSEYFVSIEYAFDAFKAVEELASRISPHLFVSEIRTAKADDLWLSTCYGRDSLIIHTTWKQEIPEVMELLPELEAKLAPFAPRPHWGKLFTLDPEFVQQQYERMTDFRKLMHTHDPEGKFRNAFIDKNLGPLT